MKAQLFHDNFQNYKKYCIPKAQLVIADIPYNIGNDAYGSNPEWYSGGDNKNGESKKAKSAFFNTDINFRVPEYMHFCSKMLIKEPKEKGKAPAMIVFCSFEQMQMVIDYGAQYGFAHYIPLTFIKKYSPQVLKANMRIVGATERAIVLYRDKLPKFNNGGNMIFDWMTWDRDSNEKKIHPTQKPVALLKHLIRIYTDVGDVVIDPCAGSGSSLIAAEELGRNAYGFECDTAFYKAAAENLENHKTQITFEVLINEQEKAEARQLRFAERGYL